MTLIPISDLDIKNEVSSYRYSKVIATFEIGVGAGTGVGDGVWP